jgi:predicted enzyme related to lactoylglutathione lyase
VLFATDDIDAAVEQTKERGVEFTGPVTRPGGGPPPMVFFVDQDGSQLLLVQR